MHREIDAWAAAVRALKRRRVCGQPVVLPVASIGYSGLRWDAHLGFLDEMAGGERKYPWLFFRSLRRSDRAGVWFSARFLRLYNSLFFCLCLGHLYNNSFVFGFRPT